MLSQLKPLAVVMCMLSYAAATTASIGTVITHGDMRVDNYSVKGNATLFDGTVVETGQASADLHLQQGTTLRIASDSRSTLFHDHLVLQRGKTEFAGSAPFHIDANGLMIAAVEPNAHAVISLHPETGLEVTSVSGTFAVRNEQGRLLASVSPGRPGSFAPNTDSAEPTLPGAEEIFTIGIVEFENGAYYLVTATDERYRLTCKDMSKFVDAKVEVSGKLTGKDTLCAATVHVHGPAGLNPYAGGIGPAHSLLIVGAIGAAVGVGIYVIVTTRSTPTPASR